MKDTCGLQSVTYGVPYFLQRIVVSRKMVTESTSKNSFFYQHDLSICCSTLVQILSFLIVLGNKRDCCSFYADCHIIGRG